MKIKELDKTVNLAWSPSCHAPIMLAAGTTAQQLDASFSTSAALEIYDLNLNEPGLDMELKSTIQSQNRFHKLVWGPWGGDGIIVGGCDNGRLQMYNVSRVLAGDDGLLCSPEKHTGHVKAVDFNPFQANLLSTGASESEIFIWDLNNVKTPMTPGAKSQPAEEVVWLSWNRQVQHILASAFATRCVVWDLRKNEPIIKLSDSNSRVRWKVLAWHPDVATQMCLASEEDSNPIIQLWDLRFATTPIKTFEGHQKGVLSIAWCAQDPELLVSCGKDSRILCWNPMSAQPGEEIVCEMVTSNQWNFEVSWCPRNPSLISTSSFDGHAGVYSLVGGQQQMPTTNKIADSFPGMEYTEAPVVQHPHHSNVAVDLRKAPKWLKRPVGASFAFGGKLVTFCNEGVHVSQVVTEPVVLERSHRLQQALASGQLRDVCHSKSDPVWTFVAATLEPDFRTAMRTLLGFTQDQLELNKYIGQPVNAKLSDIDGLTEDFSVLSQDGSDEEGKVMNNSLGSQPFGALQNNTDQASPQKLDQLKKSPFKIKIGEDKEGVICRALLAGNIELAVDLCVQEGRMTDAVILAAFAGPHILASTQYKYFQQNSNYLSYMLSAVVTKDWSQVVSCCDLSSWAEALAAILTYASDDQLPVLCERLGDRLEREGGLDSRRNSEICFVAAGQLGHLIQNRISSDISTEALQELVELVLVARRGDASGSDTTYLVDRYAQLLASQGDFDTALAYLSTSQQEDILELRERLCIASGQTPYPTAHAQRSSYYQNTGRTGYSTNPLTQIGKQKPTDSSYHQPSLPSSNAFPPASNQQHSSASVPHPPLPRKLSASNSLTTSFQNSVPAPVNSFAPPSSAFPSTASSFMPTSSFPTSQSSFPTSQSSFLPTQPSFPPSQPSFPPKPQSTFSSVLPATNSFSHSSSAFAPPSQNPYQSSTLPPQPPPVARTPVHFNSAEPAPPPPSSNHTNLSHRSSPSPSIGGNTRKYIVDPSVAGGGAAFRSSQFNSSPYTAQPYTPGPYNSMAQPYSQQTAYNSQSFTAGQSAPPPVNNHAGPTNTQQFMPQTPAAPGWNDPPTVSASRRNQAKEVTQPPPPITHPLFATGPQDPMQAPPVQQAPPEPVYEYSGMSMMPSQGELPPQVTQAPAPLAKVAEPPRAKPPLPEEHMYLQTVFDELRSRCTCTANNPQLRRKLEDVARKLEVLYDALRESKLSGATLSGLHQLVQLVQSGDYTSALQLHTQLISGPDFSQISAFMPGLKVLIQSALQLGVYLQ